MARVGGDLKTPSSWIGILLQASFNDPSCNLRIAENIGPLVRCMINDTQRLFFKSNKHWREGIASFAVLVLDMIKVSINRERADGTIIVDTLLRHEGLLVSIVQWGFWRDHRPDILKELKAVDDINGAGIKLKKKDWDSIFNMSTERTILLLNDAWQRSGDGGIERLAAISSAPIINKAYDATNMVSYVSKLIQYVMNKDWESNELRLCFNTLLILIDEADCVDKEVITQLIVLGTNNEMIRGANIMADHEMAEHVAKVSFAALIQQPHENPSDARIAFAIRSGLIEMCLSFIERFGKMDDIEQIFRSIHIISLHQKTAKAIRSKKTMIEEKLVRLEQSPDITNNQSKKLLDMLRSTLDMNGSYCCRCNKSLGNTEVMQCNGCTSMVYCSRSCQREDWLNGHELTCCKSYTDEYSGQFQGRATPEEVPSDERDAKKLLAIENNMTMIQLKLFLDNTETILNQARALDIPMYDCVVAIDLCESRNETYACCILPFNTK